MKRFVIDASVIGTLRHIVCDEEGFFWSDSVPRDAWHMTGTFKNSRCLDTLHALGGIHPPSVPDRYATMMRQLISCPDGVSIPWQHVLPHDEFKIFFKNIVEETTSAFANLPFSYYETAWTPASRVLSSLKTAKINCEKLQFYLNIDEKTIPALDSFKPKRSGFSCPVAYDRFATRTGRLTVADGPNILVLKKECRDIITSSWQAGSICYLDFRALEARIILAAAGVYSDEEDLYEHIAATQFGGTIPRDTVKTAVLAELYGISRASLKARLNISDSKLNSFICTLEEYFAINALKNRLRNEYAEFGQIRNRFGRPLQVPGGQDNLLINTYAQSTGVDVSMIGFDAILQKLGSGGIRPLFVLHDAIILDVHPDRLNDVKAVKDTAITGYEKNFILSLTHGI